MKSIRNFNFVHTLLLTDQGINIQKTWPRSYQRNCQSLTEVSSPKGCSNEQPDYMVEEVKRVKDLSGKYA